MIIVDRVTMEADLELYGYDESRLLIVSQENAYMTVLFHKLAEEVFFPTIEQKREQMNDQGPALLIMDGFACEAVRNSTANAQTGTFTCCSLSGIVGINASRWIW
jgi:hypothetical protein